MKHSMFTQDVKNSLSKLKKQSSRFNNESGVGLIELIVSILIVSGVVAAMLVASHTLPGTSNQSNARMVLQQDASLAMEEMAKAIRESGTLTVDETDPDVLTTDTAIYSVTSGILYKDTGGTTEILVGDYEFESFSMQVASFQLVDRPDGTNTVGITLAVNLNQTLPGGGTSTVDTLTFRTRAYPRNRP